MISHKYLVVVLTCICFMVTGPTLILVNRQILRELHFPYPKFVALIGVVAAAIIAKIFLLFGYAKVERSAELSGYKWFQRVLPVGLFYATTLAFGNAAYLYLDVGFIQILKSFTPVILIAVSTVAGLQFPSEPVIWSTVLISVGTAASCSFSAGFSSFGVFILLLSSLAEALRLAMTQFLLQDLKFGLIESIHILSPGTIAWLLLFVAVSELEPMLQSGDYKIMLDNPLLFFFSAVMGIMVNFASFLVIQSTSSLTLQVLGTARNIILVVIGVVFYGELMYDKQVAGYSVAVAGLLCYNAAKSGQMEFLRPLGKLQQVWNEREGEGAARKEAERHANKTNERKVENGGKSERVIGCNWGVNVEIPMALLGCGCGSCCVGGSSDSSAGSSDRSETGGDGAEGGGEAGLCGWRARSGCGGGGGGDDAGSTIAVITACIAYTRDRVRASVSLSKDHLQLREQLRLSARMRKSHPSGCSMEELAMLQEQDSDLENGPGSNSSSKSANTAANSAKPSCSGTGASPNPSETVEGVEGGAHKHKYKHPHRRSIGASSGAEAAVSAVSVGLGMSKRCSEEDLFGSVENESAPLISDG